MKYELAHDSIARQVFEKASSEAKMRRKVEQYITDRYDLYHASKGAQHLLSKDDVEYINPFLSAIRLNTEERAFIYKSKQALIRRRRIVQMITASVIIALTSFSIFAYLQWQKAEGSALFNEGKLAAQQFPTDGMQKMQAGWKQNPAFSFMDAMKEVYRENTFETNRYIFEKGRLNQVGFASDGTHAVSIHKDDNQVFLHEWKGDYYSLKDSLGGFGNTNICIDFSFDNKMVAVGSSDRQAHLWMLENGASKTFPKNQNIQDGQVFDLAFFGSNHLIVGHQREVRLWSIDNNVEILKSWRLSEALNCIALAPQHALLLVGTQEGRLLQIDLNTNEPHQILHQYTEKEINCMAIAPDGQDLLLGVGDSLFRWKYDAKARHFTAMKNWHISHTNTINAVQFAPKSPVLMTASDDRTVKITALDSGACLRTIKGHYKGVHSLKLSEEETYLHTASADGTIRKWEWIKDLPTYSITPKRAANDLIFYKNNLLIASNGGIYQYNIQSDQVPQLYPQHQDQVKAIAACEKYVLSGDRTGSLFQWEWQADSLRFKQKASLENNKIKAIDIAPTQEMAAMSLSKKPFLALWTPEQNTFIPILTASAKPIERLVFSPDAKYLLAISADAANIINASSKQVINSLKGTFQTGHFIAETEELMLVSKKDEKEQQQISIWNIKAKAATRIFDVERAVFNILFDAANAEYLLVGEDGLVDKKSMKTNALITSFNFKNFKKSGEKHRFMKYIPATQSLISVKQDDIKIWEIYRAMPFKY